MAIIGEGFVDRLSKFASIPEKEIGNYEVYGDLSVRQKSFLDNFDAIIPKIFSASRPPFSQIEELQKALSTLETEIKRNDFALLSNPAVQRDLPKAIKNLSVIKVNDLSSTIYDRIQDLQLSIFSHYPLKTEEGKSEIFSESLAKYTRWHSCDLDDDLSESRKILLAELAKENSDVVTQKSLALIIRIVVYTRDIIYVSSSDEPRELFHRFVNNSLFILLSREVLTIEEEDFLKLIIGSHHYLRGQYANYNFCEFIVTKLEQIAKSENPSDQKIIQFNEVLTIYQKYLSFSQKHFPSHRLEVIYDLTKIKKTLFLKVLPDLTNLVRNPDMKAILKGLFVYTNSINNMDSILRNVIKDDHFTDGKTLGVYGGYGRQNILEAPPLEISKFHQAGLLVQEEGGTLRLSDEWEELMLLLECDIFSNLTFIFLYYENLASEDPRHKSYISFLKGSTLLKYPQYLLRQALVSEPERFLITRMAGLNANESAKLVPLILAHENLSLQNMALLLADAHQVNNQILIDCCLKYLANKISDKFITGPVENETLDIPEKDFIRIIGLMNVVEVMEKSKLGEDHPYLGLHVKMYPKLTVVGLKVVLEKFPTIAIEEFDTVKDSDLCDIVLDGGERLQLHMNRAILSRASDYFRTLLSGIFRTEASIEIDGNAVEFLKKWMPAILKPNSHNLKLEELLPEKPEQCVAEITTASFLQIPVVLSLITQFYTKEIAVEKNIAKS